MLLATYAPDFAVAGFTAMYETLDLDDRARASIDHGTPERLAPRLAERSTSPPMPPGGAPGRVTER